MKHTTITTMCALINDQDEVLFINRKKDWRGLALPGGHINENESISDCVTREIEEETGLIIKNMTFRGITHFFNSLTHERYLIFNFITRDFYGDLNDSCEEGTLHWISRSQLSHYEFAEGMAERFPLFFGGEVNERFIEWREEGKYIKVENRKLVNAGG